MRLYDHTIQEATSTLSLLIAYIDSGDLFQGMGLASIYQDLAVSIGNVAASEEICGQWKDLQLVLSDAMLAPSSSERGTACRDKIQEAKKIASGLIESIEATHPVVDTFELLRDDAGDRSEVTFADLTGRSELTRGDVASAGSIKIRARRLGLELSPQLAMIETVIQYRNLMIEVSSLCEGAIAKRDFRERSHKMMESNTQKSLPLGLTVNDQTGEVHREGYDIPVFFGLGTNQFQTLMLAIKAYPKEVSEEQWRNTYKGEFDNRRKVKSEVAVKIKNLGLGFEPRKLKIVEKSRSSDR